MPHLFLDNDGVLADFDTVAERIFGLPPRKAEETLGTKRFWVDLQSTPNFYRDLPLMPDARVLFAAVRHLRPTILTGCPPGGWAEPQKLCWGAYNFPGTRMICCRSKLKSEYMKPGDIIVDDTTRYRHLWEAKGGIWIHHTSAADSIAQLRKLGIIGKRTK